MDMGYILLIAFAISTFIVTIRLNSDIFEDKSPRALKIVLTILSFIWISFLCFGSIIDLTDPSTAFVIVGVILSIPATMVIVIFFLKNIIRVFYGIIIFVVIFFAHQWWSNERKEQSNERKEQVENKIEEKKTECYYLHATYKECTLKYPYCGQLDIDIARTRWERCESELEEMRKKE